MIERAAGPVRCVVALLARGRESRLDMIRIGRAIEVRLVTGDALRVVGQVICPGRTEGRIVALRTLQRRMRARQREAGGRVIESGTIPTGGVVALGAIL